MLDSLQSGITQTRQLVRLLDFGTPDSRTPCVIGEVTLVLAPGGWLGRLDPANLVG